MTGQHIILHVGAHKTGTSSVQKSLAAQRDELADAGITYFEDQIFNPNNHYVFHHAFTPHLEYHFHYPWFVKRRGLSQTGMRSAIAENLRSIDTEYVVVSAEDLSILPPLGVSDLATFLFDEIGAASVSVVAVLRNPVDYLHSSIQQYTKAGLTSIDDIIDDDFANYAYQSCPDFGGGAANILLQIYFPVVEKYLDVFGADHCEFLRFDELVTTGLASGVLSAGMGRATSVPELRSNEGISTEAAVLLGCYNAVNQRYAHHGEVAPRNMELARLLQRTPGRKARFPISLSGDQLERINGAIRRINADVGHELLDVVTADAFAEAADIDLFHVDRAGLEHLIRQLDLTITTDDENADLARRYRDAALQVADVSTSAAYLLMRRAAELKPNGNLIKRKLLEFEAAMRTESTNKENER